MRPLHIPKHSWKNFSGHCLAAINRMPGRRRRANEQRRFDVDFLVTGTWPLNWNWRWLQSQRRCALGGRHAGGAVRVIILPLTVKLVLCPWHCCRWLSQRWMPCFATLGNRTLSNSSLLLILLLQEMRKAPNPSIEGVRPFNSVTGEHRPPRGDDVAESSLPQLSSSASLDVALPAEVQKFGWLASNYVYPPLRMRTLQPSFDIRLYRTHSIDESLLFISTLKWSHSTTW